MVMTPSTRVNFAPAGTPVFVASGIPQLLGTGPQFGRCGMLLPVTGFGWVGVAAGFFRLADGVGEGDCDGDGVALGDPGTADCMATTGAAPFEAVSCVFGVWRLRAVATMTA